MNVHNFLKDCFWEILSLKSGMTKDECKVIFPNLYQRFGENKLDPDELSAKHFHAFDYYIENKFILE